MKQNHERIYKIGITMIFSQLDRSSFRKKQKNNK